jgi:hypothetical protein
MRPEEPLGMYPGIPKRPQKKGPKIDSEDRAASKDSEQPLSVADLYVDSVEESGGMAALMRKHGVDEGVDFEEPPVVIGSAHHGDSYDKLHPKFQKRIKKEPGFLPEGNHDAYFLSLEEVSPKSKGLPDAHDIFFDEAQRELALGRKDINLFAQRKQVSDIPDSGDPGFASTQLRPMEVVFDEEDEGRESGIRLKEDVKPIKVIEIPSERVRGIRVAGDKTRAPFTASMNEVEDEDRQVAEGIMQALNDLAQTPPAKRASSKKGTNRAA